MFTGLGLAVYEVRPMTTPAVDHGARWCADCGATFVLTPDTIRWFSVRRLALPKRCLPCRRARSERFDNVATGWHPMRRPAP